MKLECFRVGAFKHRLVPAAPDRKWMDDFPARAPYRCLPMSIANAHGWDVLNPCAIEVTWNGGMAVKDLEVRIIEPGVAQDQTHHIAASHFAGGILTFHTGFLFRTEPKWNLLATGPFNRPKLNLSPLSGVIETDWLPFTFTMNWQVLVPGTYIFEKDEPICTVFPVPREYLMDVEPEIFDLKDDPVLDEEYQIYSSGRAAFNKALHSHDEETVKQGWQRHYFVGALPGGGRVDEHVHKLRLMAPFDRTGQKPSLAADKVKVSLDNGRPQPVAKIAPERRGGNAKASQPAAPRRFTAHRLTEIADATVTQNNLDGRAQLNHGLLAATIARPAANEKTDPSSDDFIILNDYLQPETAARYCRAFESLQDSIKARHSDVPFWQGRILYANELTFRYLPLAVQIKDIAASVAKNLMSYYELQEPLFADAVHIVRWPKGFHIGPLADNCKPDGTPNAAPWRTYAATLFLNDDFEGGGLFFTGPNRLVKAKTGRLVAYTAGLHHEHALLTITHGTCYTMPMFFSHDEARANEFIYS